MGVPTVCLRGVPSALSTPLPVPRAPACAPRPAPRAPRRRHRAGLLADAHGGQVVHGGEVDVATRFVAPTIIANPDWHCKLMEEEIFGASAAAVCRVVGRLPVVGGAGQGALAQPPPPPPPIFFQAAAPRAFFIYLDLIVYCFAGGWVVAGGGAPVRAGPILVVQGVDSIDAAIAHINSKECPLALYVFSASDETADKVVDATRSGGVCINDVIVHMLNDTLPFGGNGASGHGMCVVTSCRPPCWLLPPSRSPRCVPCAVCRVLCAVCCVPGELWGIAISGCTAQPKPAVPTPLHGACVVDPEGFGFSSDAKKPAPLAARCCSLAPLRCPAYCRLHLDRAHAAALRDYTLTVHVPLFVRARRYHGIYGFQAFSHHKAVMKVDHGHDGGARFPPWS